MMEDFVKVGNVDYRGALEAIAIAKNGSTGIKIGHKIYWVEVSSYAEFGTEGEVLATIDVESTRENGLICNIAQEIIEAGMVADFVERKVLSFEALNVGRAKALESGKFAADGKKAEEQAIVIKKTVEELA